MVDMGVAPGEPVDSMEEVDYQERKVHREHLQVQMEHKAVEAQEHEGQQDKDLEQELLVVDNLDVLV